MKHNMGSLERVLRVLVGVGIFIVSWLSYNTADLFWGGIRTETLTGLVFSIIGLAVLTTGATAFCPINAAIHANSCEACRIGEMHSHMPV